MENIFLNEQDVLHITEASPSYLSSICHKLESSLQTNWGTSSPAFNRYALMPPCGFPQLQARRIGAGEEFRPDLQVPARGRRIVAVAEGDDHASLIRIGTNGFAIRREGASLKITHDNGAAAICPDSHGCLDISMLPREGWWTVFVNGQLLPTSGRGLAASEGSIAVERGALGLIQWQHRTPTGTEIIQFGLAGRNRAPAGAPGHRL